MTKYLKLIHNWLGFACTLIMIICLATGIYLGGVDLLKRMDNKEQSYTPLSVAQKAEVSQQLFSQYPTLRSIDFPTSMHPFITARAKQETYYFDSELNIIEQSENTRSALFTWMMKLHRQLLLDEPGKLANGAFSLVSAIIILIGFYLWWLIRKSWKFNKTLPKNSKNTSLIKSHIQLGVIFSIPLFIMALSGFYITYGSWGDRSAAKAPATTQLLGTQNNWQSQVLAAQQLWPNAELQNVAKPRPPRGKAAQQKSNQASKNKDLVYTLSFNDSASSWLFKTDSIKVNLQKAQLIEQQTFSDKGIHYQLKYLARFLHDGARLPTAYLVVLLLASFFGLLMMVFTGVTFIRKNVKLSKPGRTQRPAAV